jgi:phage I-like protein
MALNVNQKAVEHLRSLVNQGKVDRDSNWSFSAEDGNALLGADGSDWSNYSQIHLAVDASAAENTKARFHYPVGKDGKVYRSGIVAAKQRAAAQGEKDIEDAADGILQLIDKKDEVQASKLLFCSVQDIGGAASSDLPKEITVITPGVHHLIDTEGNSVSVDVTPQHIQSAIRYQQLLKSRNPQLDLVIDCDHSTHNPNIAQPYAYAWMKSFRDAAAEGLKSAVEFTVLGAEAVTKKLLRYFSPTIALNLKDQESGQVFPFAITDGAFTNQPQIENIPAVLAAKRLAETNQNNGGSEMKELLKVLCPWLGKPETATESELTSALNAKIQESGQLVTASKVLKDLGFEDGATVESAKVIVLASRKNVTDQTAAIMEQLGFERGTTPEEAKAIVITAKMSRQTSGDLANQLLTMNTETIRVEAKKVVQDMVNDGKIYIVNQPDYQERIDGEVEPLLKAGNLIQAKKVVDGWKAMASKMQVVAPLHQMPAGRESGGAKAPSDTDKEVAEALGIDAKEMIE